MFRCLRLRTSFITSYFFCFAIYIIKKIKDFAFVIKSVVLTDEEKYGVHYSGTVQHSRHKNVVTWTVNERNVSENSEFTAAALTIASKLVFFVTTC